MVLVRLHFDNCDEENGGAARHPRIAPARPRTRGRHPGDCVTHLRWCARSAWGSVADASAAAPCFVAVTYSRTSPCGAFGFCFRATAERNAVVFGVSYERAMSASSSITISSGALVFRVVPHASARSRLIKPCTVASTRPANFRDSPTRT